MTNYERELFREPGKPAGLASRGTAAAPRKVGEVEVWVENGQKRTDQGRATTKGNVATLALAFALSLAGCAFSSGSTRESVGQTIHSISVSNTIQFRYQGDRVLAPLGLKVETSRQEVFISGVVQNDAQRARAVAIARDTPGVLAAYFVDTDLPGRPVSRAHYRASAEQVWAAAVGAVRTAGYQIEERREGRTLITHWRWLPSSWRSLWLGAQERIRLALYPQGDVVTVIAVADQMDLGSPAWQIEREYALLRAIREGLGSAIPPGS